jgi:gamma-glutamylputrescine oxidase
MTGQSIIARSYYQATATRIGQFPQMTGESVCDVLIIGGGFTGVSAALELAEAGYKVVLLEAGEIGSGASGRNGGQICTGFSPGQARLEAQVSKTEAKLCFDIAEDAKKLVEDRIARYKIDCDLQWGYLHCIPKPSQMRMLEEWRDEYERLGYMGCEVLSKAELEAKLGSTLYHGAMREPRAGHFHPLNYLLGLAAAAKAAGAAIYEHSRAIEINTGPQPSARTAKGYVKARYMIIGGNGYLGNDVRPLSGYVMPVTSFIVTTEPLGENRAKSLIRDNEAVADTNFILDYFRRTKDNRLLFGGRANYSTLEPLDVGADMRPSVLKVFPQLSDVKIEHAWGGYIAITSNRIPHCGRLSPNVYFAHGYSGQGVALAQMYGKLMAEAIRGTAEKFDLLAKFKHLPFPGGPIRMPLLVAAMTYYKLKDRLG